MNLLDYTKTRERQSALARRLGVPTVCVNQWAHGKRQVPADRCVDIEIATEGAVTCEELRPDMASRWGYLRGTERADRAVQSSTISKLVCPSVDARPPDNDWGSGDPRHGQRRKPEMRSGKDRRKEDA